MKISLLIQKIEWLNTWTIYMNISRAHQKWVRPNIIHQLTLDTALKCSQNLWTNLVIQMEKSGKICFLLESIKILAEFINDLFKDHNKTEDLTNKFSLNKTRNKVPFFETKPRISTFYSSCLEKIMWVQVILRFCEWYFILLRYKNL